MRGAQNTSTRLSIRWSLPETERILCPLCQEEMPFFLSTDASSPFPVMNLWKFSANLIVFFLFIYFLFKFNFFTYLFVP